MDKDSPVTRARHEVRGCQASVATGGPVVHWMHRLDRLQQQLQAAALLVAHERSALMASLGGYLGEVPAARRATPETRAAAARRLGGALLPSVRVR